MNFVITVAISLLLLTSKTFAKIEEKKLKPIIDIEFANTKIANSKVTLSFTGDALVHEDLYKYAVASKRKNFSILFDKVEPLFATADFSYANLEGPTALGINNKKKFAGDIGFKYDGEIYSGTNFLFNYHPQLITDLKNIGIDIVSTANNHTYDRGFVGINKTIDALNEREMNFVGTRKKDSTEEFYKITEVKGFKIAWIACTEMLNGFIDKNSMTLLCYEQSAEILELIKNIKAKKIVDLVFVLPHWGVEYVHTPNIEQTTFAHLFADAGADVIIGSHPHVLQPVEKYQTKDNREVFIAYSLGNFMAYQRNIDRKTSAIVYLEFSKDKNGTWVSNYSYQPTTRVGKKILPAADKPEVIKHVEKYLGKFKT